MRELARHRAREWARLQRQEARLLRRRLEEERGPLDRLLAEKVPPRLEEALERAFAGAFGLVFRKGGGLIARSCDREAQNRAYALRAQRLTLREDRRALRGFSRSAGAAAGAHTLAAGLEGVGLGLLGVGLPDIPLFSAVLLRSLYAIALRFGYACETEEEQAFLLLLITAALARGEEFEARNRVLDHWIDWGKRPPGGMEHLLSQAASALSKELLYAKFLQGVPLVGAVGGLRDGFCLGRVNQYALLKYRRRFLRQGGPAPCP